MSPFVIAVALGLLVALVGVFLVSAKKTATLQGYTELATDIQQIQKMMRGEILREGRDLVIKGDVDGYPMQVRFSQEENTPGLNIRMKAPANFTFSVVPKGQKATEGRLLLRTGDDMFDARFSSRTDHPAQAKIFLGSKRVMQQLARLGCSSKTFLTITNGRVELSELVIPEPYTGKHVIDHLSALKLLGDGLGKMPGAHAVEYREKKDARVLQKAVIAAGVTIAVVALGLELKSGTAKAAEAAPLPPEKIAEIESSVAPVDAAKVSRSANWKLAGDDVVPAEVRGWMRGNGIEFRPRQFANVSGSATDVVYQLVEKGEASKQRRAVVLVRGDVILDTVSENQIALVPVPARVLNNIDWTLKPEDTPDGDGLLVLRSLDNSIPNQVLTLHNGKPVWGTVKDWQTINFR